MKVCSCFLLFGIFAYTNSISRIKPKRDHTVVNLPKETVREYSNEEYGGHSNYEDNVHSFISRGTTVQDKIKNMKLVFRAPRVETLTNFIQEAIKILNTYEDTAFEDFFHILDNEIRKYHYSGCKFSELTQNSDTRSLLARLFKLIRGKSVSFTKANINAVADVMRNETYDKNVKELLDYINSLYRNIEPNFYNVLNELKYYRNTKSVKTHNNLVDAIRGGVRAVLFNPYTELNTNTRRELKERIEIFWQQFKNTPTSKAEINDKSFTDPVINSFKVSENLMDEVKNPESYSKNDPQAKLKHKTEIIASIDSYVKQSQRDGTEKDESSSESGKQITNYDTDEISSGQSFDSSSNSIKNSQERHEEYNTQRYMTLYTEEITYKAKEVKKRPTTTFTPRERDVSSDSTEKIKMLRVHYDTDDSTLDIYNSSHDTESGLTLESKYAPRANENYDKQQKHGKADESRSKSKLKNVKIIHQCDAVIDVQLTNTNMLKSLKMLEPLGIDKNSRSRYDTNLYSKAIQSKPVLTRNTIRSRVMRTQAEIKPQKPTALTTSPSRNLKRNQPLYRIQLSDLRENIAPPVPNEGLKNPNDQFMKDLRRSDIDAIKGNYINTYVIKRINAIENELNELKKMNIFSFRGRKNDNNTYGIETRNVTDKFETKDKVDTKRKDMKGNVIERLLNENHDLNNEKGNDGHEFTTKTNTVITGSSTNKTKPRKLKVMIMDAMHAAVIDNDNTTQVTKNVSKINVNVTKKLNKEIINNIVTTSTISLVNVTNATKIEGVVPWRTMNYSEPLYYDTIVPTVRNSQFDQF